MVVIAAPRSLRLALLALGAATAAVGGCGDDGAREEVRWRLTAEPDGPRLELAAEFGGSSCTTFDEWAVDETDAQVEIRAVVVRSGGDCTDDLVVEAHAVELEEDLGDRPLLGCEPGDDLDADCLAVADP